MGCLKMQEPLCISTFVHIADEAEEAEAVQVLNAIYDIRENQPGVSPLILTRITYSLALLYHLLGNRDQVRFRHMARYAQEAN